MKTKFLLDHARRAALLLLGLSTLSAQLSTSHAQGTAFTYQGRLNDGGAPADGIYDLRFAIYDSTNVPGTLIAGPLTNAATAVRDGLFTVTLDFGEGVFTGSDRWLEIGVRTNGTTTFSPLSPRQKLSPVPYAVFAESASNVLGLVSSASLSGSYSSPVTFDNTANSFSGSFNGNGGGLTNVNAATLSGLASFNFWQTGGNAGTTPGTNFLGTTDNQPLELWVNQLRALRLDPGDNTNSVIGAPNVIGGAPNNFVDGGIYGATIAGGGALNMTGFLPGPSSNHVSAIFGAIGGGRLNTVGADHSTIAGGLNNTILAFAYDSAIGGGYGHLIGSNAVGAVIGGGHNNTNAEAYSAIGGGQNNFIQQYADHAFIGGGADNQIAGSVGPAYGTIAGGYHNAIQTNVSYGFIGGGSYNAIQTNASESSIGGGTGNTIQAAAGYATIGGGYANLITANDGWSTIAGGYQNSINGYGSTVGGGRQNTTGPLSPYAVVAGGAFNTSSGWGGSVGGGISNSVFASYGTAGGGQLNSVYGYASTVPGGNGNVALGSYSFAAGNQAQAMHDGAFVWADSTDADFASTGSNQFLIRASGGVAINTNDPAGAALNVAGTVKATAFQGDGSGLFNVSTGALGNYVFAYTTAAQTPAAANTYRDIVFSTDAQIGGWSHTAGTAQYTANQAGLYLVQYTAQATTSSTSGTNVSVRVTLNSAEIPGSQAGVILSSTSLEVASLSRSFVASINAADVLAVQFAGSSTSSRLVGDGTGSIRPSVSLTIARIQ